MGLRLLEMYIPNCPFLVQLRGIHCQHLGNNISEIKCILAPVGSSLPKFNSDLDSSSMTRKFGHQVTLTCPAQASPFPLFR